MHDNPEYFEFAADQRLEKLEAERAILAAAFASSETIDLIADQLQVEHFAEERHRLIYQTILQFHAESYAIDPVSVYTHLDQMQKVQAAGGKEYIINIGAIELTDEIIETYINLLQRASLMRNLELFLQANQQAAKTGNFKGAAEFLDQLQNKLNQIAHNHDQHPDSLTAISKDIDEYGNKIISAVEKKESIYGVSSGFADLDRMTNGFHAGDLIIVAARPGTGKTAMALHLTKHICAGDGAVAFFSLEMSKEQLYNRLIANHAKIDSNKLRTAKLTQRELSAFTATMDYFRQANIYIDESSIINPLEIRYRSRKLARTLQKQGKKLSAIFVDYLQLVNRVDTTNPSDNRAYELAMTTRNLKSLAKELGIPIIALSQLNRSAAQRTNKRPLLSDLRESGAIEQDADTILFLHNPNEDQEHTFGTDQPPVTIELIIGKQRNGPIGKIDLAFNKQFSYFITSNKYQGNEQHPI